MTCPTQGRSSPSSVKDWVPPISLPSSLSLHKTCKKPPCPIFRLSRWFASDKSFTVAPESAPYVILRSKTVILLLRVSVSLTSEIWFSGVERLRNGRYVIVTDGCLLLDDVQLTSDITVVSVVSDGDFKRIASDRDDVTLRRDRRRRGRCMLRPFQEQFVVFVLEVGGRWSKEVRVFIQLLACVRIRSESPILLRRMEWTWRWSWFSILPCVPARGIVISLLGVKILTRWSRYHMRWSATFIMRVCVVEVSDVKIGRDVAHDTCSSIFPREKSMKRVMSREICLTHVLSIVRCHFPNFVHTRNQSIHIWWTTPSPTIKWSWTFKRTLVTKYYLGIVFVVHSIFSSVVSWLQESVLSRLSWDRNLQHLQK